MKLNVIHNDKNVCLLENIFDNKFHNKIVNQIYNKISEKNGFKEIMYDKLFNPTSRVLLNNLYDPLSLSLEAE